ncbi:hypothetical protein K438DRAFT_1988580 [Mycena galopus ATCC 62051]|nr:hypothetical protein K438DRAFT_1988580 [Mycena galopus ATCC 62051]
MPFSQNPIHRHSLALQNSIRFIASLRFVISLVPSSQKQDTMHASFLSCSRPRSIAIHRRPSRTHNVDGTSALPALGTYWKGCGGWNGGTRSAAAVCLHRSLYLIIKLSGIVYVPPDLFQHRSPTFRARNLRTSGATPDAVEQMQKEARKETPSHQPHQLASGGIRTGLSNLWLLVSGWGASGLHLDLFFLPSVAEGWHASPRCLREVDNLDFALKTEEAQGDGAKERMASEEKEGWTGRSVRGSTSTTKTSASTPIASDACPASAWGTGSASGLG